LKALPTYRGCRSRCGFRQCQSELISSEEGHKKKSSQTVQRGSGYGNAVHHHHSNQATSGRVPLVGQYPYYFLCPGYHTYRQNRWCEIRIDFSVTSDLSYIMLGGGRTAPRPQPNPACARRKRGKVSNFTIRCVLLLLSTRLNTNRNILSY
jgi:hypothetical protein